jgi:hypothetical protein
MFLSWCRTMHLAPARLQFTTGFWNGDIRWDEKAGLQRDALSSQVIDALEARGDRGDRR